MFTPLQAAAYDRWKTTPPDETEIPECPWCGASVELHEDGVRCTNKDCDYSLYPDYSSYDEDDY